MQPAFVYFFWSRQPILLTFWTWTHYSPVAALSTATVADPIAAQSQVFLPTYRTKKLFCQKLALKIVSASLIYDSKWPEHFSLAVKVVAKRWGTGKNIEIRSLSVLFIEMRCFSFILSNLFFLHYNTHYNSIMSSWHSTRGNSTVDKALFCCWAAWVRFQKSAK